MCLPAPLYGGPWRGRFKKKAVTLHVSGSRVIKLGLDASDFLHLQMRLIHS